MQKIQTGNKWFDWDKVGMTTSLLCAVHCIALPLVLTLGASSSLHWLHNHTLEWTLIAIAGFIAIWSLWPSYLDKHKRSLPIVLASIGICILISSRFIPHEYGHYLTATGGCVLAFAHYVNWSITRKWEYRFSASA